MLISVSDIVTAFSEKAIGSKVIDRAAFLEHLSAGISSHDPSTDRQPGQHYIVLPEAAYKSVSSGVGPARNNPEDYVCRSHRNKVSAYLKRSFALPVDSLAAVVYTIDAYAKDPDVESVELARFRQQEATHVLVAVLASSGKPSPLTPYRLVHNLAGGNLEAQQYSADEIRAKAKESLTFHNDWSTVAD